MAIPDTIRVGGRKWAIVIADLSAHEAVGLCDDPSGTITLDPDQDAWSIRDTLLHEVGHAVLRSQGRPYDTEPEELYVRALATGLLGVLRDNPRLTSYLFKEKL